MLTSGSDVSCWAARRTEETQKATVLRTNGWMSPDTNKSTTTTNPNTGDTTFIKFTTSTTTISTPQIISSPTTTTHTSNDAINTSTNAERLKAAWFNRSP
ncbi:unnamed protein product [Gadus morhua 'NCC']